MLDDARLFCYPVDLMETTLALDISYRPLSIVPWQTAIVWVLEKVVEVVDEYPTRYIHTPNWQVRMPSIVRFVKPIHRKRAIKFSRHGVYARDRGRCQYCGTRVRRSEFTYDHVVPRALGGKTDWVNVVVACVPCNQRKGGRTPPQAGMHLLAQPVRPRSLPEYGSFLLTYKPTMPLAWKDWLRDAVYWDGELEHDEG